MANTTVAGGYKVFGPTYNSTKYVRFGHVGTVNSLHNISPVMVPDPASTIDLADQEVTRQLAGKIVGLDANGDVALIGTTIPAETEEGEDFTVTEPVGLCVDDLGDIANGSNKVSFYFRGGEYYISVDRVANDAKTAKPGDLLYASKKSGDFGKLTTDSTKAGSTTVVAVVTKAAGLYTTGNMYEHAGKAANGGDFIGIELRI